MSSVFSLPILLSAKKRMVLMVAYAVLAASVARADWTLVWSDEFDGTALDTNTWWCELGPGTCMNGNNELQYYTNDTQNVYVSNGILHIVARNIGSSTNYYFTSARLITYNIDH